MPARVVVPPRAPLDATPVDVLAVDLATAADRVRARARRLLAGSDSAFRRTVDDLARQFLIAADRLDHAAATTRSHAIGLRAGR